MAAPGTDDPYERIAPLLEGTIQQERRDALRALLGAAGGAAAGLGAAFGALVPAMATAADAGAAPQAGADWVRRSGKAAKPGVLPFVRMYAGPDRITRVERRDIVLTDEPTPGLLIQPAETFAIRVIPPGTSFDWHKPSRPRITALLRGRATFTLRDGTQGIVLPGTICLVENVDSDGHRGEFHPDEYTLTVDVGLPMPKPAG
jgi:hypothetical protein